MKRIRTLFFLLSLLFMTAITEQATAQCSMCRRVAESNMEDGENKRGRGLNSGILYMMSVPYLLGGVGMLIWWKYRRANQQ